FMLGLLLPACARDRTGGNPTQRLVRFTACAPLREAVTEDWPAVLSGDIRTHDPSMIREGNAYYVFSTGDERGLNDGTIQIRRSDDRAYWQLAGTVFDTLPDWIAQELGAQPPNLWAPDVCYFNGAYHVYYAGSTFGSNASVIGLATNTTLDVRDPRYKWVDRGMVVRSERTDNWNAIDPDLVWDADGVPWLVFGSFWDGIKMRRIDVKTGLLDAADTTLYSLASRGGGAIEAPSIVYHDGMYYLFVSFDNCCRGVQSTYRIMVGRSERITGPYADRDGVALANGGGTELLAGDDRLVGPGGQDVLVDGSRDMLVYHAYKRALNGMPQLQVRPIVWENGWPSVGTS
ncbi:MAG: GH43_5 / GH43_3 / GH43_6 / GH43_4 / GH43 / G H43_7 / GH43_30 / GH43_8 / GH43_31 / GH43_34 / GH43 _10 / GH43_14, partial [uncultured Chloroflexia bacterium]